MIDCMEINSFFKLANIEKKKNFYNAVIKKVTCEIDDKGSIFTKIEGLVDYDHNEHYSKFSHVLIKNNASKHEVMKWINNLYLTSKIKYDDFFKHDVVDCMKNICIRIEILKGKNGELFINPFRIIDGEHEHEKQKVSLALDEQVKNRMIAIDHRLYYNDKLDNSYNTWFKTIVKRDQKVLNNYITKVKAILNKSGKDWTDEEKRIIGREYERFIGARFETVFRFIVLYNGATKGFKDGSIDLICFPKNNNRKVYLIQCKKHSYLIPCRDIDQFNSAVERYEQDNSDMDVHGLFYSTFDLSEEAWDAIERFHLTVNIYNFDIDYPRIKCIGKNKTYLLPDDSGYDKVLFDCDNDKYEYKIEDAIKLGFKRGK